MVAEDTMVASVAGGGEDTMVFAGQAQLLHGEVCCLMHDNAHLGLVLHGSPCSCNPSHVLY